MELCRNALLEVCPAACRSRLPNFVFVYIVVVLASWLNVWGGLTESANNWALEWQLEDIKKNVLKWALHWVRSFLYKDVSLVSPGLSKILVELAGCSIQSREIGAALSVRTCEWLSDAASLWESGSYKEPAIAGFWLISWVLYFSNTSLLPTNCSTKHTRLTTWNFLSSQQSQYQQMFYYMKSFHNLR